MWLAIILGTIGIICFSWWASLKDKRYHGIARFFAFEGIFILLLLNIPYWFKNPLVIHQIVSWIFLLLSLLVALHGFYLLKYVGRSKGKMENTTRLISTGLYRYIRHPLYLSLILGGLGILLKDIDWFKAILIIVVVISVFITAKIEEKEMIARFENDYKDYMRKTKMFIPYIL